MRADHLADLVRRVLDANRYVTLCTADADGTPWASPVYFAHAAYSDLYWVSAPDTRHSRNLAARPEMAAVVFDSTGPIGGVEAVYLAGSAAEVPDADLDVALSVYPGPADPDAHLLRTADVRPPSPYRMYRARIAEYSTVCPRDRGPCAEHGKAYDHRTVVRLS